VTKFLLLITFIVLTTIVQAQDSLTHHRKPVTVQLSFFNHSVSVPFHRIINSQLHPGVQGMFEAQYHDSRRSKIFQTFDVGAFHNKYNGNGFYLSTELGYRLKTKHNLFAEALIGGGYLRVYHPTNIYVLTTAGTYERAKDKGFSSPIFSFAIGAGYDIPSSSKYSLSPFIRYQSLLQTHYSPDLGVLPQCSFHVGVRLTLKRA
jgi:hypothetical protein